MKLEIDLISESYEKTLSNWASVGRTFDLAADAIYRSHCHNDDNEEVRQHALEELEQLKGAIDGLFMTWRGAYWAKLQAMQKELDLNPTCLYALYNKEIDKYGEPFPACTKHVPKLHIPPGTTLKKLAQQPAKEQACKLCEFEEIRNSRKKDSK